MKTKLEINRHLFFNDLSKENYGFTHTLGKSGHPNDYISYKFNSLGYRCKEFKTNEEMLIAGCSQTFGMGIEKEYIWGNSVGRHFNLNPANLSVPGSSTSSIINNLFAYFKRFGNPKVLICLFPEMTRFQIPVNQKYVSSDQIDRSLKNSNSFPFLSYLYIKNYLNDDRPSYQKAPFRLEEILTEDVPFFHNMKSIMMLDQYCNSNNIKFYWSVWDTNLDYELTKFAKSGDDQYLNYVPFEGFRWSVTQNFEEDPFGVKANIIKSQNYHNGYGVACSNCMNSNPCEEIILCHKELEQECPKIFEIGNDKVHLGAHQHQHFAEIIIERMLLDEVTF